VKYLRMTFKQEDDSRKSLRVPDPKDNLTNEEIQQAAAAVISAGVFAPALTELVDADVVEITDRI